MTAKILRILGWTFTPPVLAFVGYILLQIARGRQPFGYENTPGEKIVIGVLFLVLLGAGLFYGWASERKS